MNYTATLSKLGIEENSDGLHSITVDETIPCLI